MFLPAFFITYRYRGESNSMQGASVKQTRSVCSERARTPAGGRSRCGFAKQIRGFSAQCPSQISMRCRLSSGCPCPASTQASYRGGSNSVQGTGVKQTLRQRRVGRAFPMAAQAESTSRNPRSDWDVVSGWRLKRKAHPGISPQTGIHFPLHLPPQKTHALAISKLGRRKPKRNSRRSI